MDYIEIYGEIISHGTAFGNAIILDPYSQYIPDHVLINEKEKQEEYKKFLHFTENTIQKIKILQEKFPKAIKELLEIQIYFLKDPIFRESVEKKIFKESKNLALAVYEGSLELKTFFYEQATDFIKQRWIDFQDAIQHLLDEIQGFSYVDICIAKIKSSSFKDYILVSEDISPLLFLKMPKPRGILLKKGSISVHLSLLASNHGIPVMINTIPEENFIKIKDGNWILIDTNKGKAKIYEFYKINYNNIYNKNIINESKKKYYIDKNNVTISLNIEDLEILKEHKKKFFLSIGLLRTEYIYIKNPELLYDIQKATLYYKEIFNHLEEKEILTLRLIDVDEDKFSYFFYTSPESRNYRGIDYYKKEVQIIINQIQSIFFALKDTIKINWQIRIMIPMVSTYDDWKFIQELITKELNTLPEEIKKQIKIGIMIEIPSIMYTLPILEKEIDFISLGTNDLLSHFIGKKRKQIAIQDYYEPSFYRMLYSELKNFKKEISICGNLSTYLEFLSILYFCNIRNFSVPFSSYERVYNYFMEFNSDLIDNSQIEELLLSKTKEEFKTKLMNINHRLKAHNDFIQ